MAINEQAIDIDWMKCILCQIDSNDALVCPLNRKQKNTELTYYTYKSISKDIERFNSSGICPFKLNTLLTDNSETVGKLLFENGAMWHKVCRNKIDNYKYERAMNRKRRSSTGTSSNSENTPKKLTRFNSNDASMSALNKCLFCNSDEGQMRKVCTFEIDHKIRKCAAETNDTVLLAKLSAGDLIAQEAKYHLDCLTALYYKASIVNRVSTSNINLSQAHGIALGEVIAYIEDAHTQSETVAYPVHKLSDIAKLYDTRVNEISGNDLCKVNSTNLKERILSHIPYIEAHRQGRDILLVHKNSVGDMIKTALDSSYDNEGVLLTKAAKIVRRDILKSTEISFKGTFDKSTSTDSIPQSLLTLVGLILGGSNINCDNMDHINESQKVLNVSQMVMYNVSEGKQALSCNSRHMKKRETPLAVYLALLVHAETRKKSIIDKFHSLGVCISYRRLLEISTCIGNYVTECYESEGIVCPLSLKTGVFTTSAVDNIDHNPTSVTAKGSFHGTGISIFQHNDHTHSGTVRKHRPWTESIMQEERWLEHVYNCLDDEVNEDTNISWPAFHAERLSDELPLSTADIGTSALLPLFPDQAKSTAMIRHSMSIVKKTIHYLNPGQIPVMAADQPLYALAKQIQWTWPSIFGENRFVVMFGGLHIELAALKTIGDLLEDSGWTSVLTQANIATPGTAESYVRASNILRTRHAHQVTAAALYALMKHEYDEYVSSLSNQVGPEMSLDMWVEMRKKESPMFMFWVLILNIELTMLTFVRSLREGNFELYIDSLIALVPWFFALDHNNYARWIPVHINNMLLLDKYAPEIVAEFRRGNFCFRKTKNRYSAIPLDQAHEQNNKLIKDDGGAVGLTENPSQLLRWMVCGPEIARLVTEFEDTNISSKPEITTKHHEQTKSIQSTFQKQVNDLRYIIEDLGNPFAEKSQDLLVLDNRDIVDPKVADGIKSIMEVGKQQYHTFVNERLVSRTKSVMDTIKQNKIHLFSRPPLKTPTRQKLEVSSLKENCALFSQLYVSCQVRKGNIDEFFSYENASYPPSLSQFGDIGSGKKSDLMQIFDEICSEQVHEKPKVDALLLDGAVIINMLKPVKCKTFNDYAELVFLPYIRSQLADTERIDVVWDRYIPNSLKAGTRQKRGVGVRRRVLPTTIVPSNWESFLRNDDNKSELFAFLASKISTLSLSVPEGKCVISTKDSDIVGTVAISNAEALAPCTHEEADTRLLLHAAHVGNSNFTKATIKTVDTDVMVIAIAMFSKCNLDELWIDFGTGKYHRYIPVHCIVEKIGEDTASALLAFHAFTGCDQVSAFTGKGKRTAWNTLKSFPDAVETFKKLSNMPTEVDIETSMCDLQRFVILMYDRSSTCETTNEARREQFTTKSRSIDNIPPTLAALVEHTKRTSYQAGHCWGQSLTPSPSLPSPADFGWIKEADPFSVWKPFWSTLMPASKSCLELLKCGCNKEKGCRGKCKCVKANLPCTALCKCGGFCDRMLTLLW